ncbi:MAG: phosphomannomutase/phosphoglucomutase [Patescibacteria group bacterium]
MHVNPEIFKAYDVRGEFPNELNAKAAYLIARAFAEFLRGNNPARALKIVISSDARPSSPELIKAVTEGLLDEGVQIVDMGLTTTPFHYYGVVKEEADGGIMVTASHNPFRMNGLKLSRVGGEPVGDGMEVVKNIAERSIFDGKKPHHGVVQKSLVREYIDFLISRVDLSKAKDLKIVLDAGGGMATMLLPSLIKRLPCKVVLVNHDLVFDITHESLNPSKEEHLATLKNTVIEENADFGVAFDPDSDRSGFVTHNSRFFRADHVGSFFAREFAKSEPGVPIIYDVRASSIFPETIKATGGRAILSRVGHRFIKELMRKENARFAAESSGHFYFRDFFFCDSDFLPMLYFLQFLSQTSKTSDEILDEFDKYPLSGELNFKIQKKEGLLENIAGHYKDAKETQWVDGLSVYYDDWWANIRQSNTEPLVRLNVEARTKELLDARVAELKALITA